MKNILFINILVIFVHCFILSNGASVDNNHLRGNSNSEYSRELAKNANEIAALKYDLHNNEQKRDSANLKNLQENDDLNDFEKRHFSSLLADQQDIYPNAIKRHLSSLLKCGNSLCEIQPSDSEREEVLSELYPDVPSNSEDLLLMDYLKRLFATPEEYLPVDKRFFASLLRDEEYPDEGYQKKKRHLSSVFQEQKRHLSSLFHNREEFRNGYNKNYMDDLRSKKIDGDLEKTGQYERPDFYPLSAVGYFPDPQKRFLGYRPGQKWFPKEYYRNLGRPDFIGGKPHQKINKNVLYRDRGRILPSKEHGSIYIPNFYLG